MQINKDRAKKSGRIISLASSQTIRFIEEIAGVDSAGVDVGVKALKKELRETRRGTDGKASSEEIHRIYNEMDKLRFRPEYLCLQCDSKKDYFTACNGFRVNGMEYQRLLGTSGGVKQSVIVFVSTHTVNGMPLIDELRRRINNGRDESNEYIPAKLEAYMGLTCSASVPVSWPEGITVVKDCVTRFKDDYIELRDGVDGGEPEAVLVENGDVELNASDGFGLISPGLAAKWSQELRLRHTAAGMCIRNSFCKGMVFTFDFMEFATAIAGNYIIEDVWGNKVDIRDVELILTESMLKLWDAYSSLDDYIENCIRNEYTFSVTKATPPVLENERRLNYQFIQSFVCSDEQIWELIHPTVEELSDVMGEGPDAALLFLRGVDATEDNVSLEPYDFASALMINRRIIGDPYVRGRIRNLVKKRLTEAKFGKIKVHGNFSTISGDPYALCQSIWGLPVTGLLKPGQIYNKYWDDKDVDEVVCFRAPMSSHRNIRRCRIASGWQITDWYRWMDTVTVVNCWDTFCMAMNGADHDGDQVLITDNPVLLDNHRVLPAVNCVQHKGAKKVPSEGDFILANVAGFGDDIGTITNRITTQYELQAQFSEDSKEYRILDYRIMCGQKFQQENIDKLKGVQCEPMPKVWYDREAAKESGVEDEMMVADKKPYFMIYRYPREYTSYTRFIRNARGACKMYYGCELEELLSGDGLEGERLEFVENYYRRLPVIDHGSTMNRLCHMVEAYFENKKAAFSPVAFDYSILKSGVEYTKANYRKLKTLYDRYQGELSELTAKSNEEIWDSEDTTGVKEVLKEEYIKECYSICPSQEELCDILIDICYSCSKGKNLVWDICGEQIIKNLLAKNGNTFTYLQSSKKGDIKYGGMTFIKKTKEVTPGDADSID